MANLVGEPKLTFHVRWDRSPVLYDPGYPEGVHAVGDFSVECIMCKRFIRCQRLKEHLWVFHKAQLVPDPDSDDRRQEAQ